MSSLNLSGTLNILRLFTTPTLCLPHLTVPTFSHLPVPLSPSLPNKPSIRAIVLDKDNCFAIPHSNQIHPPYVAKFTELRKAYPGSKLLIVSNTAGTNSDPEFAQAEELERETGITVLRHGTKKPGCHAEIMEYFRARPETGVTGPEHVAVVGDRLLTDVMMANMMGAHAVWVTEGVVKDSSVFARFEKRLASFLQERDYEPPMPRSDFE